MSQEVAADTGAALITKAANATTYVGAGGSIFSGFSADWVGVISGIVIGVLGLLVGIYYKQQHLNLARQRLGVDNDDE